MAKRPRTDDTSYTLLKLPPGIAVPNFYLEEEDPELIHHALQLGAHAVVHARNEYRDTCSSEIQSQLQLKFDAKLQLIVDAKNRELAARDDDLRRNSQRIADLHAQLAELRAAERADFESKLIDLEARHQRERAAQTEASRELVHALKQQVADGVAARDLLATAVRTRDAIKHNSSLKGALGEAVAAQLIIDSFGPTEGFKITDESALAGRGDRLTRIHGLTIMWEIKSHNTPKTKIPTRDVQKFMDNATQGRDFDMCIMLGLYSNITGHDNYPVELEYIGHKCIVYINRALETDNPVQFIQWNIGNIIKATAQLKAEPDTRTNTTQLAQLAQLLQQSTIDISDFAKNLTRHKQLLDKSYQELAEQHARWTREYQTRILTLLK